MDTRQKPISFYYRPSGNSDDNSQSQPAVQSPPPPLPSSPPPPLPVVSESATALSPSAAFPPSCDFRRSGYNQATDTCRSGTHISELQKVDIGNGMWAFADRYGRKQMVYDEGVGGVGTLSGRLPVAEMVRECDAKDECRAVATDDRQTRYMKKAVCMSPCFRRNGNWYVAFNERSPYPFNPAATQAALP